MPRPEPNTSFAFIKTRPRVAFLDDDAGFLDALMNAIPEVSAQFFTEQSRLDEALARTATARQAEQALWASLGNGSSGGHLNGAFAYLSHAGRSGVISIIVVDHMMPGESGREFCARHAGEGLEQILLTGTADSTMAVQAFNAGDIDYFIPKQSRGLRNVLVEALQATQSKLDCKASDNIREHVLPQVMTALSTPDVRQDLMRLMNDYSVDEYIFLNNPLGIAATTGDGHCLWFQLETKQSLVELADLMRETGSLPDLVQSVLQCSLTVNMELAHQFHKAADPASAPLTALGVNGLLSVGVFAMGRCGSR